MEYSWTEAIVFLAKISGETKGIWLCGSDYQMQDPGGRLHVYGRTIEDTEGALNGYGMRR
jgi:hypothetical protein